MRDRGLSAETIQIENNNKLILNSPYLSAASADHYTNLVGYRNGLGFSSASAPE
jgi:hypothetical protein